MSGIAITIPNGRFNTEFGQVVQELISTPVTGVHITCNDNYIGTQYRLSCQFTPLKTNQRNVVWSIVSGSQYASINANNGLLEIFNGANNSSITVKAESVTNSAATDTKEIHVTYKRAAMQQRVVKSLGNLTNCDDNLDDVLPQRMTLVKEKNSGEWVQASAPPNIITDMSEDEVTEMIDNGFIDSSTLYFCEE
jgi:hypothetical protein